MVFNFNDVCEAVKVLAHSRGHAMPIQNVWHAYFPNNERMHSIVYIYYFDDRSMFNRSGL